MAQTTFVNGRGVAHKGSGGMSTVFPDLCLTKVPVLGVVPIPYPNIGQSSDTDKGPEKVLGFEYLKPDTPVRPRDPEASEDEAQTDGTPKGPPKSGGPKPRAKRGPRKPKPAHDRSVGASLVPKVPLGSK